VVCQCGDDIILSAQEDFKKFLTDRVSLEQWAAWLQELVQRVLGKCNDARDLVFYSQQLLLKWSFYSTLIIRDLTIRNATSFGSFHLLRTLFDEYIIYLVDSKLAAIPPQLLMSESIYMSQQGSVDPISNLSHPSNNGSVDSFSLENLLNKDSRTFPKHLPFPFAQDTGTPVSHADRPMPSDEDYARMEILHNENMMHLNMQRQQQFSGVPRMNTYGNWPPKTLERGETPPAYKSVEESIAANLERLATQLGPLGKRVHPESQALSNGAKANTSQQYLSPYGSDALRPSTPASLEALLNQQQQQDQSKKMRTDNQTAEVT